MGLRSVAGIVVPSATLLNAYATPLSFGECSVLGKALRHVFRQYDVSVFVFAILVFLGIVNLCNSRGFSRYYFDFMQRKMEKISIHAR